MSGLLGDATEKPLVEFAAGGLVWDNSGSVARLGIVRRRVYGDWTLPKGRPERNESWEETARREVMEELGCEGCILGFAGPTAYAKGGRPKVVLFWHMRRASHAPFVPTDEVIEVAWLPTTEATEKLTHPGERNFLNGNQPPTTL